MTQATVLDGIFSELTRRTANNLNGGGEYRLAMETYFKLAMKAQNQCRMTLETLGNIKNPPAVFARQANFNNGGQQQVNNGPAPRAPATETKTQPSKLVGQPNETAMDTGTTGQSGHQYSSLEAMDALNRAKVT